MVDNSNDKIKQNGQDMEQGPAELLRAAREKSGRSIDEVAHDLHLDRDVILALEAGDFESLGAPVFVRGYLRSYAKLLDLSEDSIVGAFKARELEPEEFRTRSAKLEVKAGASMANFVLWVALVVIFLAGALYFLIGGEEPPEDVDKGEFVEEPLSEPVAELPEPVIEEPAAVREESGQAVELIPDPEPDPEPVVQDYRLVFSFSDECWTEVSDARRRLIYGLQKAGSVVEVDGVPPFRMFLGNVEAVDLLINEQPFSLPKSRRSGSNTVRFSINADELPGGI